MSLRFLCALLTAAAVPLAAAADQCPKARSPQPSARCPKGCSGQTAAATGPHGTMTIGMNDKGDLVITLQEIHNQQPDKAAKAGFPLFASCPLLGRVVGVSAVVGTLGWCFGEPIWAELCGCPHHQCQGSPAQLTDDPQARIDHFIMNSESFGLIGGIPEKVLSDQKKCKHPPERTQGGTGYYRGPGAAAASDQVTCPYLKQQMIEKSKPRVDSRCLETSVLDNLKRLEKAQQLYREAEYDRRVGHPERARHLYRKVQRLCPGSRFDRKASARLRQMQTPKPVSTPAASEEQEPAPPTKAPPQARNKPCKAKVEKRVAQLLEAAHQALVSGQCARAEQLAAQALELDRQGVAAHPLVYKMNLLRQIEEQCRGETRVRNTADQGAVPPGLPGLLREMARSLSGAACFEVDTSRADGLRARCELEVGGRRFQVIWSADGDYCVITPLEAGTGKKVETDCGSSKP